MSIGVTVNRYRDASTYGEPSEVVELTRNGVKQGSDTRMVFVIKDKNAEGKQGKYCSVSYSFGSTEGMAELTKRFIDENQPDRLVNMVMRPEEVSAMYRAGLRCEGITTRKATLEYLENNRNTGIQMYYPPER